MFSLKQRQRESSVNTLRQWKVVVERKGVSESHMERGGKEKRKKRRGEERL